MTKRMARTGLFAGVLAMILVCAVMIMSQAVYADGPDGEIKYGKKMTISKASHYAIIEMGSKVKGAKKVTVTSSNKKVIKPDAEMTSYIKEPVVQVGKKGTATVKIKVKTKKGTKTYKGKIKVIAYKNPMKKVKLGGKDITKKFKSSLYYSYTGEPGKTKFSIKPAKGWKVKVIRYYRVSGDSAKSKKIKNNSTITWKQNDWVVFYMYNKSKNLTESYMISHDYYE